MYFHTKAVSIYNKTLYTAHEHTPFKVFFQTSPENNGILANFYQELEILKNEESKKETISENPSVNISIVEAGNKKENLSLYADYPPVIEIEINEELELKGKNILIPIKTMSIEI